MSGFHVSEDILKLPPSKHPNTLYHRKNNSAPRHEVIHLGSRGHQNALSAIVRKIDHANVMVRHCEKGIRDLGPASENEDIRRVVRRQGFEAELAKSTVLVNRDKCRSISFEVTEECGGVGVLMRWEGYCVGRYLW
jgi:hypothetical protein